VIERPHKKCRVTIHSARPGIIIGKKGADIEKLRRKLSEMTNSEVHLNIVEVRKPELDATWLPSRSPSSSSAVSRSAVP
jgi:small subunit ribosomal protein S3